MKDRIRGKAMAAVAAAAMLVVCGGCRDRAGSGGGRLVLSGNVEAETASVGFKVAGRIRERPAEEGRAVRSGEVLARLDDEELAQIAAQAEASLGVAEAEAKRARIEFNRQKDLFAKSVISSREFEVSEAACGVATSLVRQAQAALDLARTRRGYAILASPLDGVVLAEHAEAGEYVAPGTPVVTIGKLDPVWVRGYVGETDLGRVRLGQQARVFSDSRPGQAYEGRLTFLASEAEFTPRSVQTRKERVKLVFRVKIEVPNPGHELKPGMPVEVELIP